MTAPANRYQVIAPLARGGMGEILLARRLGPAGFEKLVVLKRPLHTAGSRALVIALIEEARLLARINHPNVCQVHDLEQAGDQFFFTMEYLEGLSMWAMLAEAPDRSAGKAGGNAPRGSDPRMVCGLFEQACDGLDAIHAMRTRDGGGIVHRDVSPGNLFVTERGVVKVLDLGIAKSSDSEEHTPFGRVKGKLGYLSPEQAAGRPIDHRSDLFSLGLVLHDVVHARRPSPDRIGALAADALDVDAVPRPLGDVIRRAVAYQPADRFTSAREMAAALRAAGTALGGSPAPREIAAWLVEQFAPELARRRALAQGTTAPGDATPRTQILSLQSASGAQLDERHDEAPRDPPPVRKTERLDVPTRERLTPIAGGELLDRPAARRRRVPALTGVAAAIAIGLGAWAAARVSDGWSSAAAPTAAPGHPPFAAPPATASLPSPPAAPPATDSLPTAGSASASTQDLARTAGSPALSLPTAGSASASTTAPPPAAAIAAAPDPAAVPDPPAAPPRAAPLPRAVPAAAAPSRAHKPRRPEPTVPGQLTIDSRPFAVIRLGDRELGTTPLWRVSLPPGQYEFQAATADGRTQRRSLRIEPGHERKVMLDWNQQ